jgi:hypothetical protein
VKRYTPFETRIDATGLLSTRLANLDFDVNVIGTIRER